MAKTTKFKNPNYLMQMIWQNYSPEINYGLDYDDRNDSDPLSNDIKISTKHLDDMASSGISRWTSYTNGKLDLLDTSIFHRNLGTKTEYPKESEAYEESTGWMKDSPDSEDILRSIALFGTEDTKERIPNKYGGTDETDKVISSESKEITSVEFNKEQGFALNYLFRAMESKVNSMQNEINRLSVILNGYKKSEESKNIHDRLDQAEKLIREHIFGQLWSNCSYYVGKRRVEPLPDNYKDRYYKIRKSLDDYISKFLNAHKKYRKWIDKENDGRYGTGSEVETMQNICTRKEKPNDDNR